MGNASESRLARLVAEADALDRQGRRDEAEGLFQAVLREDAGNFDALHRIGANRADEGRHREAVDYLQRALERNPDSARAHYNLGIARAALGQPDDAMACFRKAVGLDPDFAEAHTNLGNLQDAAGLAEAAIASYRRALSIKPDLAEANHNLIRTLLRSDRQSEVAEAYRRWLARHPDDEEAKFQYAMLSGSATAPRAPAALVARTFDRHAATFDAQMQDLGYRAPRRIAKALACAAGRPRGRCDVLDAGCGTGLCGPHLRGYARRLTGVDLSSGMIERARAAGVYDALEKAEISDYMVGHPGAFDLIVAADVLIYFGPLAAVLAAAHSALRPRGLLVFTVERAFDYGAPEGYRLNPHGRYGHSRLYLLRAVAAAGFGTLAIESATLRTQDGRPVAGFVMTCEKIAHPGVRARTRIRLHALRMSFRRLTDWRRRRPA